MADPYIGPGLPGVAQPAPVTQKTVGGMTPAELAAAAKRAALRLCVGSPMRPTMGERGGNCLRLSAPL